MGRTTGLWALILILNASTPAIGASNFEAANAPGAIGETGSLYLMDRGIFARPFYNDVYGHTDKQLTGALQLGYLWHEDDASLESRVHWLAITPTFTEQEGIGYLEKPVGRYADWIELQESLMHIYSIAGEPLRLQATLGVGHIGDHGARKLHRKLYRLIGSSLQGLEYNNQPAGIALSGGFELGIIDGKTRLWGMEKESMLNFGLYQNKFMTELYLNQNHVFTIDSTSRLGLELRMVRQAESGIYPDEERLAWRFELAAGFRYKWYRPSIKYVSPFLRGDQVGQTYLDPLAVVFDF